MNKTTRTLAILMGIMVQLLGAQTSEQALDTRLKDQVKPVKVKTASEMDCKSFLDPHDKALCYKAQANEAQEKASKATKEARKLEPRALQRERNKEERARRQAEKEEQEIAQIFHNVSISGCPADSVQIVNKKIGFPNRFYVSVAIRVTNSAAIPVELSSPRGGVLVRNLCSTGALTLFFNIAHPDGETVTIPIIATARPEDGGLLIDKTSFTLTRSQINNEVVSNREWEINPTRRTQAR